MIEESSGMAKKAKKSCFLVGFFFLLIWGCPSDAWDTLDPNGNITIKWDVIEKQDDGYTATVSILNLQLYRHVEAPGWRLTWVWAGKEIIWGMWGAEATEQGNCSTFTGNLPHCCERKPVIVDLLPGASYSQQYQNCCKGGVLSSMTQDPAKWGASFQMSVGRAPIIDNAVQMPSNFSLGLPGYTCGQPFLVPPTKFPSQSGQRWTQAVSE